jgi:hypothetical protein
MASHFLHHELMRAHLRALRDAAARHERPLEPAATPRISRDSARIPRRVVNRVDPLRRLLSGSPARGHTHVPDVTRANRMQPNPRLVGWEEMKEVSLAPLSIDGRSVGDRAGEECAVDDV